MHYRDSNLSTDVDMHTVMDSNLSTNVTRDSNLSTDVDMHTVMDSNLSTNVEMHAVRESIMLCCSQDNSKFLQMLLKDLQFLFTQATASQKLSSKFPQGSRNSSTRVSSLSTYTQNNVQSLYMPHAI